MKETRFKDTEIGRIPEEWEVKVLGKVCDTTSGGTPARSNPAYYEGNIPWITTSELKDGHIYDSKEHITISAIAASSAKLLPESTLLMAMYGATIGKLGITTLPLTTNQACCAILPKEDNIKYLFYKLLADRANLISKGCGAGQPNISQTIIKELKYSFPGKVEQSRIAAALTSVDDLISALDKLIEKKKNIKQGSMQLLLTGKKRLKGFTDPWVEKKMGTIEIQNGAMLNSTEYKAGNIPVIAGGKQPAGYHSSSNRLANTITISASGANAGYISFYKGPIFASDCSTINEQKGISIEFLYYCLLLRQNAIYKCQTGGAQPHIHAKDIKDIGFAMPSDISEQKRIASIIESMDDEISSLEAKKAKYEQVKQGMMQQLLTGKIRLIEEPA